MFNFLNNIGPTEIILLLLIVLLFFGSKIAVGIARSSGETFKELKKVKSELVGEEEKSEKSKKVASK